jgi:hypothetical protein
VRLDLTDNQIRNLLRTVDRIADGRGHITTVEAGQIRRMAGELQELRAREAVTRHLSQLEGAY